MIVDIFKQTDQKSFCIMCHDVQSFRVHATRRMFQRHIGEQDVEFLLTHGQVIERYDEDFPLPSVLLNGLSVASRPLHIVVGINIAEQILVIITSYEPDPLQWTNNFSRRIV